MRSPDKGARPRPLEVASLWEGTGCFCLHAIEGNIFFFVVDCAMETEQMLRLREMEGQYLLDLVLADTSLGTTGLMIVLFYTLLNLVSGWQCGATVKAESRLHPFYKKERRMRIKSGLEVDAIEKNTPFFKMDCGTASCKQTEEILNVMKNMMNGTQDLMLNSMKCKMIKVGKQ